MTGMEVAVIGMAGQFPGAKNLEEFWDNLKNGRESISFFSTEELFKDGINSESPGNPEYVKAQGCLEEKKYFDAYFFAYIPREAELMEPQIRIFHEYTWKALEDSGYEPGLFHGLIGLFAGASNSFLWESLSYLSGKNEQFGGFEASILVNKDFLPTRISYNLDLKGPSFAVQTACSTSLVAIHLACRALLTGECKIALAGGISIIPGNTKGYLYQEGVILSADGHCRAFDAASGGTTPGEGVGVVVLKRFNEAVKDRDLIYAVIKGSAVNNDGKRKVGYTAPSVEGQVEVIRRAQRMAKVETESISYIETHGTGTKLGDPIEIKALKKVFAAQKSGSCGIGSVKTNIGHLDAAAGVAGFIKTVLALKYRLIPPSLHFSTPNPDIGLEDSPFFINSGLREWKNENFPLRAGVSSFGIGGTNAHVILEGNSENRESSSDTREYKLILLSAKTRSALDRMTENLSEYFKTNPGINLADAAYTLQSGRRAFPYRRVCTCSGLEEAAAVLANVDGGEVHTYYLQEENDRPVIFMFPGQGSQYLNMGLELYKTEKVFQEEMDNCFGILESIGDDDLRQILYPGLCKPLTLAGGVRSKAESTLGHPGTGSKNVIRRTRDTDVNQTYLTQPIIFVFEYALARLLMRWGIEPYAMIGHSIGEYVAACLAGVFTLQDALKLVVSRGRLMHEMPPASMLSVSLPEDALKPLLGEELSLAAVNTPFRCVVSGPDAAVIELSERLLGKGIENRRLHTSHAFHSWIMDPVIEPFGEIVKKVHLNKPGISYISNVSGKWITAGQAVDPGYWAAHLREPVRFSEGLKELLKNEGSIFLEVGAGKSLSSFVRQHGDKKEGQFVENLVRHPKENVSDDYYLMRKIGQLWLSGIHIDWPGFYSTERRSRISLPTYSFERQYYWIDGDPFQLGARIFSDRSLFKKKEDIADWFYIPSWKRSGLVVPRHEDSLLIGKSKNYSYTASGPTGKQNQRVKNCLVFIDNCGLGSLLVRRLKDRGRNICFVKPGKIFGKNNQDDCIYTINPEKSSDYLQLFKELKLSNRIPGLIIHLWSLTTQEKEKRAGNDKELNKEIDPTCLERISRALDYGFYSQLYIARAIRKLNLINDFQILVVSNNIQEITGEEVLCPEKATLLGALKVIPQEFPNVGYRSIDVVLPSPGTWQENRLIDQLVMEVSLRSANKDKVAAYRNNHRWVQTFEPVRMNGEMASGPVLRKRGVYLITGGLGNIGLVLAKFLARSVQAKLVLIGRTPFPERSNWEEWLSTHDEQDKIAITIHRLKQVEAHGGQIMILSADAANPGQMREAVHRAEESFGQINGIIHAAGILTGRSAACPVEQLSKSDCEEQFRPKIYGLLVLEKLFKEKELDFCLLASSLSSILGGLGFAAYAAANLFMDAFAQQRNQTHSFRWISVNWDGWRSNGLENRDSPGTLERGPDDYILQKEGEETFARILSWQGENQVIVSVRDLKTRLEQWIELKSTQQKDDVDTEETTPGKSRPGLSTTFTAPRSTLEQSIAKIWGSFFGIKKPGINDDFFEMGGDSLKMMTFVSKIQRELSVEVPLADFFNHPTIKGLAEYIGMSGKSRRFIPLQPVEKKTFYTLSSAQMRLYAIQQMDTHSTGYNLIEVVLIEGDIERKKLEKSIRELIKRHEVLRTSIQVVDNEPVQRIHDAEVDFTLEYNAGENDVEEILKDFVRPFDLMKAPFFRIGLIKMGEAKHVFVLDIHHIITDGVSAVIFVHDLMAYYSGRGSELPPLQFRYRDYSEWQNSDEIQKDYKYQEAYWLMQFKDGIPLLSIPTDYPRPEKKDYRGAVISCDLEKDFCEKLDKLARVTGTTTYMILFSAYSILLSKYSGQEDIVVGSPVTGRRYGDVQDIMGVFVNVLALRNRPSSRKTYKEFLLEVKENVLAAYENQDYPFDNLVKKLRLHSSLSLNRNPLFDILFQMNPDYSEMYKSDSRDNHFKIEPYEREEKPVVFDMVLFAIESGEVIRLSLRYSTSLFKRTRCEKMIKHYLKILNQVTKNNIDSIKLRDIHIPHELVKVKSRVSRDDQGDFGF